MPLDELQNYQYHFTKSFALLIRAFENRGQESLVLLLRNTMTNFNTLDSVQSFIGTIELFTESLLSHHQNAFGAQTMNRIRALFMPGKNSDAKIPFPSNGLETLCTVAAKKLVKAVLAQPNGKAEMDQVAVLINSARNPARSEGSVMSSQRGSPVENRNVEESEVADPSKAGGSAAALSAFSSDLRLPPRVPFDEKTKLLPKGKSHDDDPQESFCCCQ